MSPGPRKPSSRCASASRDCPSFRHTKWVVLFVMVSLFQGKVEASNPGRLQVYMGDWFTLSWKITNTGGVAFANGTKLSRVRARTCSEFCSLSGFGGYRLTGWQGCV